MWALIEAWPYSWPQKKDLKSSLVSLYKSLSMYLSLVEADLGAVPGVWSVIGSQKIGVGEPLLSVKAFGGTPASSLSPGFMDKGFQHGLQQRQELGAI